MTDSTPSHAQPFDARITQAVENIVRPLHRVLENELAALVEELAGAIAAERTVAFEQARDAATAEKESAVRDAVAAARAEHEAELSEAKRALTAEREAAVRDVQAASEAAATVAIAEAVEEAVSGAKAEAAEELAAVASAAERRSAENVAEAEARAAGALQAALTDTLVSERQADLAAMERLLATIRAIDGARAMSEVLDAVADHVLVASGRVAVFLVRDGKLRGWRFGGFPDFTGEARDVELTLEESGVIARAVTDHDCAATSDRGLQPGENPPLPPGSLLFLPAGRAGFAAPVCVAGQTVAVVYADEGNLPEPPVPSPWPEVVEIIARHASRCLELQMAARVAAWTRPGPAEPPPDAAALEAAARVRAGEDEDAARRYARLLISEIKLYHESDVNQGKRERDMLQRLKPEIDRARRLFEERVPPDVRARTDCFEQELVRTLADGNASLLGQST